MIKSPLISIIIPTYNDYLNLKKNIDLIKQQNFEDYELIIINDNSTDSTQNYLNEIKDPKIFIHHLESNKGPGYARNFGINHSNGLWVSFLDSDDEWSKNRLFIISEFIKKNNKYDLICHNEIKIYKEKNKKVKLHYGTLCKKNPYKDLLLNGNRFSTSATIVKKNFLIKNKIYFNERRNFISVEDYDFWLKCIDANANFKHLKEFLGYYYIHNNNITSDILKHKKNYLRVLYHHTFKVQKFEINKILLWKKVFAKFKCELAIIYLKNFKNYKLFFNTLVNNLKKEPIVVIVFFIQKFYKFVK